jgi:hypothetical protein
MNIFLKSILVVGALFIAAPAFAVPVIPCAGGVITGCPSPTYNNELVQNLTVLGKLIPGSWTTATRPASPVAGQMGFNTTTHQFEYWNNTAWVGSSTALGIWTTSTRPASPTLGTIGFNSTIPQWEYWSGSAWTPVSSATASLAQWTTSTRPATPTTGEIGFNSTIPQLEFWSGSAWTQVGGGAATLQDWTTGGRPGTPSTGEIGFNTTIPQLEYWNGSAWTQVAGSISLPFINAAAAPYGVKCDNATDDTTHIQAAINAAGGQAQNVMMPAGICLITDGLTILSDNVHLIGQGGANATLGGSGTEGGTIIETNKATGNLITIGSSSVNVSGTLIQGIMFESSVARTGGAGIYRYAGLWNILRDVKLFNLYQGYVIDGHASGGPANNDYDNFVYDSSINSNSHGGVIVGVAGNTVSANFPQNEFFYNTDVSVNGIGGMILTDCGGCNLSGVQGILNDVGVLINPGTNQGVGIFSTDLQIDSAIHAALDFEATGNGTITGQFGNSWLASAGTAGGAYNDRLASGIRFNSPKANFGQITFIGGKIYNNAGPGVYEAQATQYLSFTGVDNYSNSAYGAGASQCPTGAPACNNSDVYANYMAHHGTSDLTIAGGNWGVGNGLLNQVSYGLDSGSGVLTNLNISGVNLAGTLSSGTCVIDSVNVVGGIRCGGTVTSKFAALVGTSGASGGVTSTGGSPGNVAGCTTAGCTQIGGSAYGMSGTNFNPPSGAQLGASGFPWAGIWGTSPFQWNGATASLIPGSGINITGVWPNQTITATTGGVSTAGGSAGNVAGCNNAGCTQIAGMGIDFDGTHFYGPSGSTLGSSGFPWHGLFLDAPLPINEGGTGTTSPGLVAGAGITVTGVFPNQTVNATAGGVSSAGGSPGAIAGCTNSGCSQIGGNGLAFDGTHFNAPGGSTLGDSAHPWHDLNMDVLTFTPTLTIGGAGVGSYSRQAGGYQTIGHMVFVNFSVIITTTSGLTGNIAIGGLPVLSNGTGACTVGYYNNMASITNTVFGEVQAGTTYLALFTGSAAGAQQLSHSNVTSSTQVDGTCIYMRN